MIVYKPTGNGALSKLVDVFWYFDSSAAPEDHGRRLTREKVLPTGTFEFVFNLDDDRIYIYEGEADAKPLELSGAITCGVHSRYFVLDGERRGKVAGVHFRPGGAYPLLRQPAENFANKHANLEEIFGPSVSAFRSELARLKSASSVFSAFEVFLSEKINPKRMIAPCVLRALEMLAENSACSFSKALQPEFGVTQKTLIDAFKRNVGLTPKTFSRVLRFQEVLKQINCGEDVNWVDTALGCGYYDQAHFARDFRNFSGFSPGDYRARVGENPNHVLI